MSDDFKPERFGRYTLFRRLAAGGMGEVFLARTKGPSDFEKVLVVKRILPHLSEEEEFIQMFFDEARIASNLNHPHIAQIYEMGEVDGLYYIAMEYVAGVAVRELNARANRLRAAEGGFPLGLKCRIFCDAASALDYAHHARTPSGAALELIHRDVSPSNILVGFNGAVKLIDFGVARAAQKLSHTRTGHIKGKYAYMSPEQARGEDLDPRSDLFGLGICFWETLTSQRLFKRGSDPATLKAVVKEDAPPPSTQPGAAHLPPALDAIVLKALAKKRADRFASCGEFQLALEDFLTAERLPSSERHLEREMALLYPGTTVEHRPEHTPVLPRPAFEKGSTSRASASRPRSKTSGKGRS